jgi:hypothetical protein
MARLTQVERSQLQRTLRDSRQPEKAKVGSLANYIAFATFASRLSRKPAPKLIQGGDHWKL